MRKKKLEIVQVWRCASCKRNFTPGPAALRNKTYPIRLVLQALTLYDLGYSLSETAKRLKSKSGRAVSPSTIATWIGSHKEHTTFRRLRAEATTIYPPEQTIRSIKLYHRQVYAYAYHRSKLTLSRCNPQHRRFEALATFLESIPSTCPHELFRREDDPKAPASHFPVRRRRASWPIVLSLQLPPVFSSVSLRGCAWSASLLPQAVA